MKQIVLIDGEKLAQYMIDHKLGVSIQNTYKSKELILIILEKSDFFTSSKHFLK